MEDTKKHTQQSNKIKTITGTVVSVQKEKTVRVEVSYLKKHSVYKKALRRTKTFTCHSELADIVMGDRVEISQIRPMSKTKHFKVLKKA